jgi:hypothetical protein
VIRLTDSRSDGHHEVFPIVFLRKTSGFRRSSGAGRRAPHTESGVSGAARALLVAGMVVLWATAAGPAGSQAADPVVSARLLAPIPTGAAIAVEPLDDSDDNLRLRDQIAAALTGQTRAVAADGPLVLRFVGAIEADIRRPGSGIRGPRAGRPVGRPLRDNFGAGDTNPAADGARAARPSAVRHALRATLEQRDGTVLWQGEASRVLVGNNEQALWRELGDALVGAFGRTVDTRVPAPGAAPP